jgi:hypothetical protein
MNSSLQAPHSGHLPGLHLVFFSNPQLEHIHKAIFITYFALFCIQKV